MRYFIYTSGGDAQDYNAVNFVTEDDIEGMLGDWLDVEYPSKEDVIYEIDNKTDGDWGRYMDEYPKEGDLFPCVLGSSSYRFEDVPIFKDSFVDACMDKLIDTFDGGYPGEWKELAIEDSKIKEL